MGNQFNWCPLKNAYLFSGFWSAAMVGGFVKTKNKPLTKKSVAARIFLRSFRNCLQSRKDWRAGCMNNKLFIQPAWLKNDPFKFYRLTINFFIRFDNLNPFEFWYSFSLLSNLVSKVYNFINRSFLAVKFRFILLVLFSSMSVNLVIDLADSTRNMAPR